MKPRTVVSLAEPLPPTATHCSDCINNRAVYIIRSGSDVTFHNVADSGSSELVSFYYSLNEPTAGEAYIALNDAQEPIYLSDLNFRAGHHRIVPVQILLQEGEVNTVTFEVEGTDDFEILLDGMELYE